MAAFLDVCRFNPTAGGTTDWTYSSAVTGYQSLTAAGAVNGATYSYRAESVDLTQWEVGTGAYNSGTGVLTRAAVLFNSSGTTSKINFSAAPQVAIVALAEDLTVTKAAAAADQEAASSALLAVTPSIQQRHPSAAKAWVKFVGSAVNGAQTISASFNVSSVSRTAIGVYTITFTTAFSSADYGCMVTNGAEGVTNGFGQANTTASGSMTATFISAGAAAAIDPPRGYVLCFGDQ